MGRTRMLRGRQARVNHRLDNHTLSLTHLYTHTALNSAAVDLFHTHNTHTPLSETTSDPSPCSCREFECQSEWDGNGVENETDKEASGNVEQLWAKIDKLNRGLSDPGFEPRQNEPQQTNLTDSGSERATKHLPVIVAMGPLDIPAGTIVVWKAHPLVNIGCTTR